MTRRLVCECGTCRTCTARTRERAKYRAQAYGTWEPPRVQPQRYLQKLRAARDHGWTVAQLADATGLNGDYLRRMIRRDVAYIGQDTAAAIRRLPDPHTTPPPATPPRPSLVAAVGTVRRVQALLAMGWRHEDISKATGLASNALIWRHELHVTRDTANKIKRAYDDMSMRLGPSATNRRRARLLGYAPPLAWDDESIDDPNAEPEGVAFTGGRRRVLPDPELLAAEVNRAGVKAVAKKYEVNDRSVSKALARGGYRAVGRQGNRYDRPTYMRKEAA